MELTLNASTMIVLGANIFLGIVMPILLYFFFSKRYACSGRVFFAGCSTMIAVGLVVPMLINFFVWPTAFGQFVYENPWLYALFMALVAGLIHEPGRYLGAKYFLDDELWDDHNAIMFGVGYGSMTILVSMLSSALGNFLMAQTIANGQVDDYLSNLSPEDMEAAASSLVVLCTTPVTEYIMLIVEPCIETVGHVALSVLVWYAVQGGKKARNYLLIAMGMNFVLEFAMSVGGNYAEDGVMLQVLRAVLTAGMVYIAVQVWKKEFKPVSVEE